MDSTSFGSSLFHPNLNPKTLCTEEAVHPNAPNIAAHTHR